MPIKWMMILLLSFLILTPIGMIMDKGYLDATSAATSASGEESTIDLLMGDFTKSETDTQLGAITTVIASGNFLKGVWKVMSADYSFFSGDNWIVNWFRWVFIIINVSIVLGIVVVLVNALAGAMPWN